MLGCIECDNPAESHILLRLRSHDGLWYDSEAGFDFEPQESDPVSLQVGDNITVDGATMQIMPVDDQGNPLTWYEYDRLHGKEPPMGYETYVYLKWIMIGFDESGIDRSQIRFGKKR